MSTACNPPRSVLPDVSTENTPLGIRMELSSVFPVPRPPLFDRNFFYIHKH